MALQGPFAVIADSQAPGVVEALRAAGAFPIIEATWSEAATALGSVEPEALILADPCPDRARAAALAEVLAEQRDHSGLYMPVIALTRDDGAPSIPDALAIAAAAPAPRLIRRLSTALRIRNLHGTVLRRIRTLVSRGETAPELSTADPLGEATVLVAGRGRSYPNLSVAVGERVAVVGALSIESAARALKNRDIDGVVIGDGFGARIVEALLTVLAEDLRFRDLPVAVLGGQPGLVESFAMELANIERVGDGVQRLVDRFIPYVRAYAYGQRFKRMLKSLDAQGMLDPDTGLLAHDAFWRDLNRAVDDAEKRGVGLSIARFSFAGADRRLGLDAARLVGRLLRRIDFACREADNSVFAVFTETDLRAAHVVARRIASVLKHTMLAPEPNRTGIAAEVTLATLKPTDSVDSLIARVVGEVAAG
ncbi:MAG TPA: GGDEF domain-containing protein [Xanthobacteraceae bacterium]|nr:GGDEF domain-containing protein [Xanthobacteraceae bacterium]